MLVSEEVSSHPLFEVNPICVGCDLVIMAGSICIIPPGPIRDFHHFGVLGNRSLQIWLARVTYVHGLPHRPVQLQLLAALFPLLGQICSLKCVQTWSWGKATSSKKKIGPGKKQIQGPCKKNIYFAFKKNYSTVQTWKLLPFRALEKKIAQVACW